MTSSNAGMSFFRDLHLAAQDLRQNGLNLDALRDEVGTERREPLPQAPPLKGTPKKEQEEEVSSVNPRAQGSKQHLPAAPPRVQEEEGSSAEAPKEEMKVAGPLEEKKAAPFFLGDFLAQQSAKVTEATQPMMSTLSSSSDFLALQTSKVSGSSQVSATPEAVWLKRADRLKKEKERWEREAASQAARCASASEKLTDMARRTAAERSELAHLREAARKREEVAHQTSLERDACAAELEQVALRQVDALQAEVASLKREKKRADHFEKEFAALKATLSKDESKKSEHESTATEVRSLKLQLNAARSAAAASARAARAEVDFRKQNADSWEQEASRVRLELRETRALVSRAEAERDALRRERDRVAEASKKRMKQQDETEGLRSMLKEALEGRTQAEIELAQERQARSLAEHQKADIESKAQTDAKSWAGELAAARKAARDARMALVDRRGPTISPSDFSSRHSSDDDLIAPCDSASNIHFDQASDVSDASLQPAGSGAAEYLKSVVVAALPLSSSSSLQDKSRLPASKQPDATTRARLVPVLRSLLALPHETVLSSLEALAKTKAGGDFALALVLAASGAASASDKSKRIVSRADAAEMREDRVKRIDLQRALEKAQEEAQALKVSLDHKVTELRESHDDYEARLTAEKDSKRRTLAAYETETRQAIDLAKRVDSKCASLAAQADQARAEAQKTRQSQLDFETKVSNLLEEQQLGLNQSQLDYLRATLATILKGYRNAKLRAQLIPVLVNILKLPTDDPRAQELVELAHNSSPHDGKK